MPPPRSTRQDGEHTKAAGYPANLPALELLSVDCGPSDCPVDERLELSMDFALDQPLRGAWWEVKVRLCAASACVIVVAFLA